MLTEEELVERMAVALIQSMAGDPDGGKWFLGEAEVILDAIHEAGFRIVPTGLSLPMLTAAMGAQIDDLDLTDQEVARIYSAILAASPISTGRSLLKEETGRG